MLKVCLGRRDVERAGKENLIAPINLFELNSTVCVCVCVPQFCYCAAAAAKQFPSTVSRGQLLPLILLHFESFNSAFSEKKEYYFSLKGQLPPSDPVLIKLPSV